MAQSYLKLQGLTRAAGFSPRMHRWAGPVGVPNATGLGSPGDLADRRPRDARGAVSAKHDAGLNFSGPAPKTG
jgi:alkanesulfonate monooxygenase SsuD/methylene tetrahydromethanopterin reductase-like flavin-dependent oxidoreductase (luciferase family)